MRGMSPCDKPECTWSEAHRALCEARSVCRMADIEKRREYLALVEKHRGKEAADQLREAVKKEWEKQ
ncbi:MAG: hypothetical protein LBU11_06250 [Zoogloeaceae bacterium]|jgi:hypothetical protein|nr:hypothetical protein [Zoogloeaceae bacterium]